MSHPSAMWHSWMAMKAGVKAERIMKKVNSLKYENIYSSSR